MIKRFLWVGIGVGVGILAARKVGEARALTAEGGLNRAVGRLADSIAATSDAFRDGMASRETELRSALGIDDAAARGAHRR
jgi:hypothetical protein